MSKSPFLESISDFMLARRYTVQQQLGHFDVKTTEIYTHVLKQGAHGVKSR